MKAFLIPAAFIHQLVCRGIARLYRLGILRPQSSPLPIIGIGNLAFGGSEKTPLAMEILSRLLKLGFRPALISRGYKGKWEKSGGILSDGKTLLGTWKEGGDEPVMIAGNFPNVGIFIGKNRMESCRRAKEKGFDIAVFDDAFQFRRIKKDLEIVLHDPSSSALKRESLHALNRCDILLIKKTGAEIGKNLKKGASFLSYGYHVSPRHFVGMMDRAARPPDSFQNLRVITISGIARPERFLDILKKLGIEPIENLIFPDHFAYPSSTIGKILKTSKQRKAQALLTTEKDAIKLVEVDDLHSLPVYYLKIGLDIEPEFDAELNRRLESMRRGRK